jgi:hypothetical protein
VALSRSQGLRSASRHLVQLRSQGPS